MPRVNGASLREMRFLRLAKRHELETSCFPTKTSTLSTNFSAYGRMCDFIGDLNFTGAVDLTSLGQKISTTMKRLILLSMVWLFSCAHAQNFKSVDTNVVKMGINADGGHFWDYAGSLHEVPRGTGLKTLFAGEWWIGGLDDKGSLHISAETYRQIQDPYRAGPANDLDTTMPATDKVWKVSRSQIIDHQMHFPDPNYSIPIDILTWPGNGDVSIGESAQLAPYFDVNGNGIYEPTQGDFPCIRGDMAVYAIYSDDFHSIFPANVEVHTMLYAFNGYPGVPELDSVVFNHTRFIYKGQMQLTDVYAGQFIDFDLGDYTDDYVGCDVGRNLFYAYNGDEFDGQGGYGLNPPAQGVRILKGPLAAINDGIDNDHDSIVDEPSETLGLFGFMSYSSFLHDAIGVPSNAFEYYYSLHGKWNDGTQMVFNQTNGHAPTGGPGTPTTFLYPSVTDPNYPGVDWSEATAGNTPSERRVLGSVGPMTLNPGDELQFDLMYGYSRAFSGGRMASLGTMRNQSDAVAQWFEQQDFACTSSIGLDEAEVHVGIYPNPTSNYLNVSIDAPIPIHWTLYALNGQVVMQGDSSDSGFQIDVRNLPKASYLIEISGPGVQVTKPVVVQ